MTEPDFLTTTRASYDTVAADYAAHFRDELAAKPLDLAMLTAFAGLVRGRVADVGCGHGHVTSRLHALGLDVFGVDLSPRMVALAGQAYPGLRFEEGTMTALDVPDDALGGLVALFSIIHVPDGELPHVFAEFHRVLAPGGHALLAFQVGEDEHLRRTEAFGHEIALDYHQRRPDRVAGLLGAAGLPVTARLLREPDADERVPRAYLLARKAS
ncbi:methyltransferase domain-containing protein [Nonomuraea sp. NN258]|uniref:class I SAM-dependent DNA methyltransferase n=1 Tax=Nonomuraea antri TaxID=2730852 RepID=UPI0015685FBF|nr:class I SAM-dependent methyltransferase [Nonomuraea antri]NRQ33172.1 methyltransferase domain-containing protein [Nonomuraea antri]